MGDRLQLQPNTPLNSQLAKIVGTLDEGFTRREFSPLLPGKTVLFDMEGVKKITSFGVREWLEGVRGLKAEYYAFARCRPAVVAQFNMVSGFLGKGHVLSFYAPYTCPNCSRDTELLLDVRAQFAALSARQLPQVSCPDCQTPMEFDDIVDSYLSFLTVAPKPPAVIETLLAMSSGGAGSLKNTVRDDTASGWNLGNSEPEEEPQTERVLALSKRFDAQLGRTARVLLVDPEPAIGKGVSRTLRTLAREIETRKDIPASLGGYDVVIARLNPETADVSSLTSAEPRRGRLILYASRPPSRSFLELLRTTNLTHFLWAQSELDGEELYVTIYKILSGEIFGLGKYFSWGARAEEHPLTSVADATGTARNFAQDTGLPQPIVRLAELIAGTLAAIIPPGQGGQLSLSCDGRRLGIGLASAGLDAARSLALIDELSQKAPAISHFVMNAKPNASTEMITLLDLRAKPSSQIPSFSLFGEMPLGASARASAPAAPPVAAPAPAPVALAAPPPAAAPAPYSATQSPLFAAPPPGSRAQINPIVLLLLGLLLGGGLVSIVFLFLRG